jgi:hypothetical protein
MGALKTVSKTNRGWGPEAFSLALQARVLSGEKLDQLVRRLQRNTGNSREACWRFVIQHGLKGRVEHRRWTEEEIDEARELLAKHSVEEVAKKLKRTAKALRCVLHRNDLSVRDIRCDCLSVEAIARVLHVRREEVLFWIKEGWLPATSQSQGKRRNYVITPEAFAHLYKKHLHDLLGRRRLSNLSLFEAFYQYCYVPKHTVGEQLLDVRRDKRERAAYEAMDHGGRSSEKEDIEDDDLDDREGFEIAPNED